MVLNKVVNKANHLTPIQKRRFCEGPGLWGLALVCASLAFGACKKDKKSKDPESAAQNAQEASPAGEGEATFNFDIDQIPDPPELATAAAQYWKGEYEALIAALEGKLAAWTGEAEKRAAALAHAWIALAHTENLPENAESHLESALSIAQALKDPELLQIVNSAKALHLVAVTQAEEAKALVQDETVKEGQAACLLQIARAKMAINLAFDRQERLRYPKQLDAAKLAYEELAKVAPATQAAILGHVHEGLAAIAKYKGDSKTQCAEAKKAFEAYTEGKASDYLQSGPQQMLQDAACKG